MTSVVVGLGKTGASCLRYFASRGIPAAATDSRRAPPGLAELGAAAAGIDLRLGGFDLSLLDGASQVLLSPGVSTGEPIVQAARARGIDLLGDIELFARARREAGVRAPVLGITGTNGKSTVTTLVAAMAQRAGRRVLAGGNLGIPALDLLARPVPELYVLELSSFQLDSTTSLELAGAVVLNVTADHLDRYGTVAEYARAKARIFAHAATVVLNADDARVAAMRDAVMRDAAARAAAPTVVSFSTGHDAAEYGVRGAPGAEWLVRRGESVLAASDMKLRGRHNTANALAALALGDSVGLPLEPMLEALRDFPGLPHRSAWVGELDGVGYIDDSKGTNVGATLAAVAGLPGPLILIAGGQGKGQDFAPLAAGCRAKVRHAVLIGVDAPLLASALEGTCSTESAASMPAAVAAAARAARPGDTVLLSPACASLDMFKDYAERGEHFAAAVRALGRPA